MFKELINHNGNGRERPVLNGAYIGRFLGVKERQRPTFETRNHPEPTYEDVFVFEFEVEDDEGNSVRVSKWVRKPTRLTHPSKNGKVTNLYRVLAALYGVAQMTDALLERAEEFVENEAIGREYQLTLETKPSGWVEIVHIAPVRKARNRKKEEDEEVPF
jgi:hypothetical protein